MQAEVEREPSTDGSINELDDDLAAFTERMEEVELATRADGERIEATVVNIDPDNAQGEVEIRFQLPNGDVKSERMPEPERASDEYKFVRVCRGAGATISTCHELLVGGTVEVTEDNGEWQIEEPQSTLDKARQHLEGLAPRRRMPSDPESTLEGKRVRSNAFFGAIMFPFTFTMGAANFLFGISDHHSFDYYTLGFAAGFSAATALALGALFLI